MSGRRGQRQIRGPQSALTDFLAANNISAQQIRDTFAQRQAAAEEQNEGEEEQPQEIDEEDELEAAQAESSTAANSRKRKRSGDVNAKEKLKAKKKAKKGKKGDDSDDDYSDLDIYAKSKPKPGQLENCDICNKRFTVTPYTKEGPDGGLLCTPCGKQITKEAKKEENKGKKAATGRKRRQAESNRLDGIVRLGSKSLQDLCIEKVAKHHTDVEELGDLPDELIDRLGQIFAKKRVLDSRTLQLFIRFDLKTVSIHDAAKLEPDDFKQIFAVTPSLEKLVLRNAGQFKDSVMEYMLEKAPKIKHFQLYGANLLNDDAWDTFFKTAGPKLESVKIEWCDASFTDGVISTLVANCPNLKRLKLKYCRKLTSESISHLIGLKRLEHLSLRLSASPETDDMIPLIERLGPKLVTLSLENCGSLDDLFLDVVRKRCCKLSKLRLEGFVSVTDAALVKLFTTRENDTDKNGSVVPPLTFLDLAGTRDMEDISFEEEDTEPYGLADNSFRALMSHSGPSLKHLNISSSRAISHGAFCDVFAPQQNYKKYAELKMINVTFCSAVETNVIKGIWACCPSIERVVAFGCFKVGDVGVPGGVALIGVPRAQDDIEKIGEGVGMDAFASGSGGVVAASA
ncbi:MAG: hypothetical protein Q9159_000424 [Coniocarpon cinnabarinum]